MRALLTSSLLIAGLSLSATANAGTYCHKQHSAGSQAPLVSTHAVSATREGGIAVYRPAASINSQRISSQARAQNRARAQQRALAAQREIAAIKQRQTNERLTAIEAKQDALLASQAQQARAPQRKIYYGNPRFFGRNGFYGNRNFSGISSPAKGYGFHRSRKAIRH